MASERVSLSTHYRDSISLSEFNELSQCLGEFPRLHVVGETAEVRIFPRLVDRISLGMT
jgi:hypothetical protein